MIAKTKSGRSIVPGEEVSISVQPLRVWGTTIREIPSASPIQVDGTVLSITFEWDPQTNTISWHGEASANVPVECRGAIENHYRIFQISAGNCS